MIDTLPKNVHLNIASYLRLEGIQSLKNTCKVLNNNLTVTDMVDSFYLATKIVRIMWSKMHINEDLVEGLEEEFLKVMSEASYIEKRRYCESLPHFLRDASYNPSQRKHIDEIIQLLCRKSIWKLLPTGELLTLKVTYDDDTPYRHPIIICSSIKKKFNEIVDYKWITGGGWWKEGKVTNPYYLCNLAEEHFKESYFTFIKRYPKHEAYHIDLYDKYYDEKKDGRKKKVPYK